MARETIAVYVRQPRDGKIKYIRMHYNIIRQDGHSYMEPLPGGDMLDQAQEREIIYDEVQFYPENPYPQM